MLVRASQTVTYGQEPRAVTSAGPAPSQGLALRVPHLLRLRARLEQALLDGELQQVVIFVTEGLAALCTQHAVPLGHLEHGGVHLTWERAPWVAEGPHSAPRTQRPDAVPPPPSALLPGASTAEPGPGTHTELSGSSQPHRLPNVMRALSTWKRGISGREAKPELLRPEAHLCLAPVAACTPAPGAA